AVLDLFHLRRIARSLFERFRLRPPEREQKRIEEHRENNDRQPVILRNPVQVMQRVNDRDRYRLYEPADLPPIAEIDQIDQVHFAADLRRKRFAQMAEQKIILRSGKDLRNGTIGTYGQIRRYQ